MASFVSKPIISTQTIGEQLRKAREGANFSLEEISVVLRIKKEYLEAIEQGRYADLPGEIYGLEFTKRYASALRMDPRKAASAFHKEHKSTPTSSTTAWRSFSAHHPRTLRAPILGRSMLGLAFIGVVVYALTLGYGLLGPPKLSIITPSAYMETQDFRVVIQGHSKDAREVLLNGEPLLTQADGSFTQALSLAPGNHLLRITAIGRAGKEASVYRVVSVLEYPKDGLVLHNN